jgi:dUTP pyrophosphatase
LPVQNDPGDAGFDLFAAEPAIIEPMGIVRINLGFRTRMHAGTGYAMIKETELMASLGVAVLGGIIGSGFEGDWHVTLCNLSRREFPVPVGACVGTVIFGFSSKPKIQLVTEF